MKYRTTNKAIQREQYIADVHYCGLQEVLSAAGYSPFAYHCGVYGWNWDAWRVGGVVLVGGYRSLPHEKNTYCGRRIVRYYEQQFIAREAAQCPKYDYDKRKKIAEGILSEFIEVITDSAKAAKLLQQIKEEEAQL